ncbi:MAG: hypothetical protein KIT33_00035 [Candidatus Kapabacteria bacterium]|nr:hypothetical protein [Ignavibacteriota bacterium]MCW5883338.1 hypothetical protein [Candidatus Kapabacteria bacterium]
MKSFKLIYIFIAIIVILGLILTILYFKAKNEISIITKEKNDIYAELLLFQQANQSLFDDDFNSSDDFFSKLSVLNSKNNDLYNKSKTFIDKIDYKNILLDSLQLIEQINKRTIQKNQFAIKDLNNSLNLISKELSIRNRIEDSLRNYSKFSHRNIQLLNSEIKSLNDSLKMLKKSIGRLEFINHDSIMVRYFGNISDSAANGFGVGIFGKKAIYEGFWKDNLKHGEGIYTWANGDIYKGEYLNGKRSGFGVYYFSSGERYEGNWDKDLRNGKGKIYDKNNIIVLEGIWENDRISKPKNSMTN